MGQELAPPRPARIRMMMGFAWGTAGLPVHPLDRLDLGPVLDANGFHRLVLFR